MLRLKSPAGEVTPELYKVVDDLCSEYGQNDLRATTRQCFQIHGILKGNLKTVISSIMNIGSSTVGACGDVVRWEAWRKGGRERGREGERSELECYVSHRSETV